MGTIPTHFSDEKNKAYMILGGGAFASLILLIHLIQFAPILAWLPTQELNAATWAHVGKFFSGYYDPRMFIAGMQFAWNENSAYTIVSLMCMVLLSAIPAVVMMARNPYRTFDLIHGDARRGVLSDIREMENRKQVGIRGGRYLTLGQWPANKQPVRLIETLSVLVLAPPGTGKCLRADVPVLRFDSNGLMEVVRADEIVVGDMLVNPQGLPTSVLATSTGREPMFAVRTCGEEPWHANKDHILPLETTDGKPRLITIAQYMALPSHERDTLLMRRSIVDADLARHGNPVDVRDDQEHAFRELVGDISRNAYGTWERPTIQHRLAVRRRVVFDVLDGNVEGVEVEGTLEEGECLLRGINASIAQHFIRMTRSVGLVARRDEQGDVVVRVPTVQPDVGIRNARSRSRSLLSFDIRPADYGEKSGIVLHEGNREFLLADFTVTHNTATFVIPSILETDDSSFIVNDPKPELFEATSGWRRELGPVFKIDWSATDDTRDPDPAKWIFYPRFNVLSPKLLPPAGTAERDTYLDAIANVLAPSEGGGKNDYFEQKGRAALVGFLHYICSKIVDQGNMEGLPLQWQSAQEPCIPMIIDMINEGLRRAADENDAKKEEAAKTGGFHQGDALSDWLKAIVKECMDHDYNPRAATEITPLISMAPNERSGILGTMDKAFIPFKNAAVRERTASCDFVPADLRGMIDPVDGEMKPVTLYMCVNQAEAAAFATITSLVYEVLSREFLAYGPNETNKNNVTLGPFPVCFMLDEFAKLPKIESVMTGPDLGRSKKTYYCLVAQSDSQIGKIYSKEDQQIIYATTAVKFVLPQNDEGTISLIQKMVGDTTIKRASLSRTKGGDFKEWGKSNESQQLEKVSFIRPGDISSMKIGTHMLICQGFMSRPYILKSVAYFLEPEILAKAYNPRTKMGPKAAPPLPEFIRQRRVEETLAKRQIVRFDKYNTPLDGEGVMIAA